MQTQQVVSFREMRTKVKTPGTGKNMVGEAVQTPLYPSPGFMPGLQHKTTPIGTAKPGRTDHLPNEDKAAP
jgi:hypothetical protein